MAKKKSISYKNTPPANILKLLLCCVLSLVLCFATFSQGDTSLPADRPGLNLPQLPEPLPAVIKRVAPAVCTVLTFDNKQAIELGNHRGHGSGFFIKAEALQKGDDTLVGDDTKPIYVVTNYHVIRASSYAQLVLHDGSRHSVTGVAAHNEKLDIALLTVSAAFPDVTTLTIADASPRPGEEIIAIGTPAEIDLQQTITRGICSAIRVDDGIKRIQHDAATWFGNSGGPALNNNGEVVGINTYLYKNRFVFANSAEHLNDLSFYKPQTLANLLRATLVKHGGTLPPAPPVGRKFLVDFDALPKTVRRHFEKRAKNYFRIGNTIWGTELLSRVVKKRYGILYQRLLEDELEPSQYNRIYKKLEPYVPWGLCSPPYYVNIITGETCDNFIDAVNSSINVKYLYGEVSEVMDDGLIVDHEQQFKVICDTEGYVNGDIIKMSGYYDGTYNYGDSTIRQFIETPPVDVSPLELADYFVRYKVKGFPLSQFKKIWDVRPKKIYKKKRDGILIKKILTGKTKGIYHYEWSTQFRKVRLAKILKRNNPNVEETSAETNDQKLLALCKSPGVTARAIEALLKAGADIEARDERGKSPLLLVAGDIDNVGVIEVLLRAGADIEARDEKGKTPLIFAAERASYPEIINMLLKAGANAMAKDADGRAVLDYAKANKKIYKTKVYWKLNEAQYE